MVGEGDQGENENTVKERKRKRVHLDVLGPSMKD